MKKNIKGNYLPKFTWDYDTINTVEDFNQLDINLSAWLKITDGRERHVIYKGNMLQAVKRFEDNWRAEENKIHEEFQALKEENKDIIKDSKPIDVYIGDQSNGFNKIDGATGEISQDKYDLKEGKYEKRAN